MTLTSRGWLILLVLIILITAITWFFLRPRPEFAVEAADYSELDGWVGDDHGLALAAFRRGCVALLKMPARRVLGALSVDLRAGDWRDSCSDAETIASSGARAFFEANFKPYRVMGEGDEEGVFTGYFEPEYAASLTREEGYANPLYARPPELVTVDLGAFRDDMRGRRIAGSVSGGRLVPFADRASIDDGALAGRGLEIAWLADPVDAFFLAIQGSGRLVFEDSSMQRVGFAGPNGHVYTAVGGILIRRGEVSLENMSMQAIRRWIDAHPGEATELMQANASYVFFRNVDGDGPIGSLGVPLSAERSLAVDQNFIPLGAPLWLEVQYPEGPGADAVHHVLNRLMVAQDTGGAIRGAVRGDVFWGHGSEAALRAGAMNERGGYFLLLPNAVAARLEPRS